MGRGRGAGRFWCTSALVLCLSVASLPGRALAAPPTLETFVGVVGGAASGVNVPGVCSAFGPVEPEASFFPSSLVLGVPQGGIAACGFSGDVDDVVAVNGPLVKSRSLAPVLLGAPGFAGTFEGAATAEADYRVLGAAASGTVTPPGSGSPLSLNYASAAAIFHDVLTATSPQVANASPGFVRYTFAFDGTLLTPGTPVSGIQGFAQATLHLEHNGGPNFTIVRADVSRGSSGTLLALDGSAGTFVAGVGSITGTGSFTSANHDQFGGVIDQAFTWGQPFQVKAGLMATVIGDGDADFLTTATLTGIEFFDASHAPVSTVTLAAASGTFYGTCTFTLTPTTQTFGPGGASDSIAVTTPKGCAWSAVSNADFITVTGGGRGNGNGTVQYSVAPGSGTARQGTLTVAGQTFNLTQVAACTFAIAPMTKNFAVAGGTGTVTVTAPRACTWTATSNDAFLQVTAGATGNGNGTVQYAVAAHTGAARQGTLTIAGQTFTVTQDSATGTISIDLVERIRVIDSPGATPPTAIALLERVTVADAPGAAPPAAIGLLEGVTVADAPGAAPPAAIALVEGVRVTDAPGAAPPAAIAVLEGVRVADAPGAAPPAAIAVVEGVTVADASGAAPPAAIAVVEDVTVAHAPGAAAPAAIAVLEGVTVSDIPGAPSTP